MTGGDDMNVRFSATKYGQLLLAIELRQKFIGNEALISIFRVNSSIENLPPNGFKKEKIS